MTTPNFGFPLVYTVKGVNKAGETATIVSGPNSIGAPNIPLPVGDNTIRIISQTWAGQINIAATLDDLSGFLHNGLTVEKGKPLMLNIPVATAGKSFNIRPVTAMDKIIGVTIINFPPTTT